MALEDSPAAHETVRPEERGPGERRAELQLGRGDVLKQREGVYGFGNGAYGATLGKGKVEFVRPFTLKTQGQPRLSFELVDVRTGSSMLTQGGEVDAKASPEDRVVLFDRGPVVERYSLLPDALEQSFVIRSLPTGRGEITVRGRISTNLTPPPDGTSGPKLSFASQDREVLTLSEAVAFDATGSRQEVALAYAGGVVSMTVPADWVARATLPITIDPLMGGPVTVDPAVSAAVGQVGGVPVRLTDAAYNAAANEWLLVWQEQFGAGSFDGDVFAQRVSAGGTPLGAVIPIAATAAGEYEPAVSWAPAVNRYLIAWRHDPADDSSDADQFIAGAILNADGTVYASAFTLADAPGQDVGPTLAAGAASWLCVFTNVVNASNTDVLGRFVGVDGLPGTALAIDVDADLAAAPSVDITGGIFLIAWQKGAAGAPRSIVARTVDETVGVLSAPKNVDQSALDCVHPDVSAGGGQFLIVWQQEVTATDHNVVGRRATTALTFPKNAASIRAATSDQLTPRVQFSAAAGWWYVVYSDDVNGNLDVYGSRVDLTGKVYGANRLTNDPAPEGKPELAWNSATDEMLVSYFLGAGSPLEIRAQRVSMDFVAPSVPGTPVPAPNPSAVESVAVTWAASVDGGSSGFSKYTLQRSADGGAKWQTVASPISEAFADVVPHGEYLYRVRATDLAGNNSAWSPVSTVLFVDPAPPAEPGSLAQADGLQPGPLPVGGATASTAVVLSGQFWDLGLLDGFEDRELTIDPQWSIATGTWAISLDGTRVLHDGSGLDDVITAASPQASGAWEYRFRMPSDPNQAASFYLFLDSVGLGGNGYEVRVTAGASSTKSVSLYRVEGASSTRVIGSDANWTPDTAYHVLRAVRDLSGRFELSLDGTILGAATESTPWVAASTAIRHVSTRTGPLRVDYVRLSASPIARSRVKLQVEVKPVASAFDGTGLLETGWSAGGVVDGVSVSGLTPGGYHWRARAMDERGNAGTFVSFGGNAETAPDFTVLPASPPVPPTGLTAGVRSGLIDLSWTGSANALRYAIKKSLTHGGPYDQIDLVDAPLTSFTVAGLQTGTTYYFVVTALNGAGESGPSNEAPATPEITPGAPSALGATAGNGQVFLSWSAPAGPVTYVVKRAVQQGGPYGPLASAVVPTTYTDNAVSNGTTYYYVVHASNTAGESGPSNEAIATPSGPPPIPAGFNGVALSTGSIRWSWSDVEGEAGYRIHDDAHATIGNADPDVVTFTESGLLENTAYSRHVHGVFGSVPGGASNSKLRSTLVHDAVASDFSVTRPAAAQVTVTVTPPANGTTGNTGVQIERSADGGPWIVVKPFSKVYLHQDFGLSAAAAYAYRIRFQNADAIAGAASAEKAAPPAQPPAAPVLAVAPFLTSMLQLRWNDVADSVGYAIHDEAHTPIDTTGPHVVTYTKIELPENTSFTLHVHALGAAGPGAPSNSVTAFTGVHAPFSADFSVVLQSPTQVDVAVVPPPNPAAGLTGCEIQRWASSTGWVVLKPFSAVYSATDATLPGATTFRYRIRYQNGTGLPTEFSPEKSVTTPSGGIAAPTNFVGTVQSTTSILWTWTNLPAATGYVLRDDVGVVTTLGPGVVSYLETGLGENSRNSRHLHAQSGAGLSPDAARDTKHTFVRDATTADFTATATSMSTVDLTFVPPPNPSSGATRVRVERSTDGTTWKDLPLVPGLYLFSDAGLRGATAYQYRFRYVNGDGVAGGVSAVRTATTPEATVGPVAGLTAAPGSGGVLLQWTANAEPALAGYNIYRSGQTGGPYSKMNGTLVTSVSYVDGSVAPSTGYFYVVRAQAISGGEGANSNEASVTTANPPPSVMLGYVRGTSSTSIEGQLFPFFFGMYSFELHDDAENVKSVYGPVFVDPESPPRVPETGLSENTSYTRHVHTVKDGILSAASEPRSGYTLVHDALDTDFTLSWVLGSNSVAITVVPPVHSTEGQTGVAIERFTGTFWAPIGALTGTYSYEDPGRTPGVPYQYRIKYLNGDGIESAPSPGKSIISPSGIIGSFTGVAQSPSSIHWSWSAALGATEYRVHDTAHALLTTVDATTLTYDETGLQENAPYSRHVHANTDQGEAVPSPTAVVHTLMHDPLDADFTVAVQPNLDVRVVVATPPGSASGSTGCEIQRLVGGVWVVVKSFSPATTLTESGLPVSTTISYRIRYRNGDGVATAPSPSKDVMTGPPPVPSPTGLAALAQSPFSLLWSWDNFTGAEGFVLHDVAHTPKGTAGAGVLSLVEGGLGENSLAVRHLHALQGGFESNASAPVARYTLVHDALPGDFVPNAVATDVVDVPVAAPPQGTAGLTGCLIERSPDDATWTPVKPYSNEYFVRDTGLSPSTVYYYRVTFRNGDGVAGLPSPSRTVSTLSIRRPVITTAPKKTRNRNTGVQGTAEPGLTVTVLFNGIPDGTRVADGSGQWSYSATSKAEGTYTVAARASNGSETTGDSAPVAIRIDLTPPPPPTRIRATGYGNAIDVEWDPVPVPDLAGYLVYRKEAGSNTWDLLNSTRLVLGAKYRDTTAVTGRRYAFKVIALDDARND